MDLEDAKNIILIGYTAWKWYTEYDEKRRKRKKRSKGKPSKRKPKKRK